MDFFIPLFMTLVFIAFCCMLIAAIVWVTAWFVIRTRDRLGLAPDPYRDRGKHMP